MHADEGEFQRIVERIKDEAEDGRTLVLTEKRKGEDDGERPSATGTA
jgi:hypothetical protein